MIEVVGCFLGRLLPVVGLYLDRSVGSRVGKKVLSLVNYYFEAD